MASLSFAPEPLWQKRISLADIDAVVSARLGATRTLGNAQPACFNRQVAMFLVARVGRWSTTAIGRFYNGRDHSIVCHGIQRIEALRDCDPDVDSLLIELRGRLIEHSRERPRQNISLVGVPNDVRPLSRSDVEQLAQQMAERLTGQIRDLLEEFLCQGRLEPNQSSHRDAPDFRGVPTEKQSSR